MRSGDAPQVESSSRPQHPSPIVRAIAEAERHSTGEIRVHLSRRWIERDALARAWGLFRRFGMHETRQRNAVLLYVNLRRHRLAIVADEGLNRRVRPDFWQTITRELCRNLRGTHHENAVALAVRAIGEVLKREFPARPGEANQDELSNEVTQD